MSLLKVANAFTFPMNQIFGKKENTFGSIQEVLNSLRKSHHTFYSNKPEMLVAITDLPSCF